MTTFPSYQCSKCTRQIPSTAKELHGNFCEKVPAPDELKTIIQVEKISMYTAAGHRFGVSHDAIRKHLLQLRIELYDASGICPKCERYDRNLHVHSKTSSLCRSLPENWRDCATPENSWWDIWELMPHMKQRTVKKWLRDIGKMKGLKSKPRKPNYATYMPAGAYLCRRCDIIVSSGLSLCSSCYEAKHRPIKQFKTVKASKKPIMKKLKSSRLYTRPLWYSIGNVYGAEWRHL